MDGLFFKRCYTQQHQEEVICIWVSQVRDLAYDAEDLIERYVQQAPLHRRDGIQNTLKWFSRILWTCDAWTLHKLGSEIDDLTSKMSELTKRLRRYGIQIIRPTRTLEYNNMVMEERRTYSHTEEDVVGLKEDIKKVVHQLVKTQVKVVAISGIGGLGKSTLARKVFKHKDVKDYFNDNCAWVYISKEFDHMNIFQAILSQLEKGEEARKRNEENNNSDAKRRPEEMAEEISKLLQGKKWLVVVDDIWDVQAWKRLKPAFESIFTTAASSSSTLSSSSKILLTTRNQGLLRDVDPSGYPHLLQRLSDDESWELLKGKAFIGHGTAGGESSTPAQNNTSQNELDQDASKAKDEPVQMERLGRKMLEHCKGLPIAIVALGGILSTRKTTSQWEDVEKNISSYLMGGKEQGGELLKVLELSYFDLPFYLKPCFLYFGNFPEDHQISTQRLYHLWEAEGLLTIEGEAQENEGTSYDIGERYLNELVQRSMVQVRKFWASGKIKSCQVHDIIRDMCLKKCKEVCFLRYIEHTRSDGGSTLPVFSNEIKKLRRCAVYDENGDFLDTHFQNGERVTGVRSLLVFRKVGNLQKIWKAFPLLRVLDLEGAEIYSIDGVESLIHLRYLSLRKSEVEELPSGLYDLKYLETLDLRLGIFVWLKNEFYKMKRLRHLYLPRSFSVESLEKLMFPAGGQMETIKCFHPDMCETKELMEMTSLRVFSIVSHYEFDKAEKLKWVLKAPMIQKEGQLINCLRLRIKGDAIKEEPEILSCAAPRSWFKELTVRSLWGRNMGNANETMRGDCITLFPDRLIRLELESCKIGEGDLLDLEKLRHLEYLALDGPIILGATRGRNRLSLSPGSFPQLRELDLGCWEPEWDGLEVGEGALPNLQCLKLNGCPKVKNMPNSLTQVKLLSYEIGSREGVLLLALEKLPRLQQLEIRLVTVAGGNNKWSLSPNSFLQLITLEIYFPVEWEELCEWEIGDGALPNLKTLILWKCKKNMVKNIPSSLRYVKFHHCEIGEDLFLSALEKHSRLEQLEIFNPEIESNKMSFSPGSFPQLTHLQLMSIDRLEEWVQQVGDGALPNLKSLELHGCKRLTKLKNIPNSLTRVKIHHCDLGEGLLLSTLEKLPRLDQLEISLPSKAGNKMSFSPSSFPRLTQLRLMHFSKMEKWEVGERALPTLQRLELHFCSNLKKIEVGDGALPTLQRLELYYCSKLKKIEVGDGALPTLQHLELKYCEKLNKLPEGLPDSIHIEKYNTCPHFKKQSSWRSKPKRWLHNSCA